MFVEKPGVAIARLMNCRVTFFFKKREMFRPDGKLTKLSVVFMVNCLSVYKHHWYNKLMARFSVYVGAYLDFGMA